MEADLTVCHTCTYMLGVHVSKKYPCIVHSTILLTSVQFSYEVIK